MPDNNITLAITTIGDLLLNNKITRGMDLKPIENVVLTVPNYQRPYKWSARNAIQLLDDIIEAKNQNKEVYRVGTLILHKDKDGKYNIVDGQQRTTTFSLLLYALYENEPQNLKKEIAFIKQEIYDNEYAKYNIPNNLNAFRRRVGPKKGEDSDKAEHVRLMKKLRDFIESQCELIVVITDNVSEAFQFFDSQNARGKALYPHDLLKAYHLREMDDVDEKLTEKIVKEWEAVPQKDLASFFGDYLYRVKEWVNGNRSWALNEHNIYKFKGITKKARSPYAQFYKSAFSYAEMVNSSAMPFVSGTRKVNAFQLNTPIIAGKPFFDYAKHYYTILKDVQDNNKFEGFYISDNEIVKTLDKYYKNGTGNKITRLLFDTSLLLYVDRFCPESYPDKEDLELFEQFVIYAFVWAYSLRSQYDKLGWLSAQNYILETSEKVNSLNIYRSIVEADTPASLLSNLADKINPVSYNKNDIDKKDADGIYLKYHHFFDINNF